MSLEMTLLVSGEGVASPQDWISISFGSEKPMEVVNHLPRKMHTAGQAHAVIRSGAINPKKPGGSYCPHLPFV